MLRRIESLSSAGIFEDFRWDATTPDFERVNLIYGTNGAGKTSLSRALDGLTLERGGFANASIRMCSPDGTSERTSNKQHDAEFERLFVFSDAYVERSHNFDGDTELAAVLTLGDQTVEDEKRIAELRTLIKDAEDSLPTASANAQAAERALETAYISIARGVVSALSRAGKSYASNSNYSSRMVKTRFAGDRSAWVLLPDSDREAALATVNSDERQRIAPRTFSLRARDDLPTEAEAALTASPVSEVLDTLRAHPHAASWVEAGQGIHTELDQCIFCGSELTDERKAAIERHFSDEVTVLQRKLDGLIEEVEGMQRSLSGLLGDGSLASGMFDDLRIAFERAHAEALNEASVMSTWLDGLRRALEQKRKNVVAVVEYVVSGAPSVDGAALEKSIADHNGRVDRHATLVQEAAKKVELHLLKSAESEVDNLVASAESAVKAKSEIEAKTQGYRAEVAALENVEGDPLPSAEVMAKELTRILGRNELSFELLADGKHYRVTRHGEPARGLSTGERTAITLIHFLEAVKRADAQGGKPVVVIDDPVSSLDSGSSMGISTYIWSEALSKAHIEQIFLLTHNFELFRQWDIQIDGLKGDRGPRNKHGFRSNTYELIAPYRDVRGTLKRSPKIIAWPPNEVARKKIRSAYHHAFLTVARAHVALREDSSMEKKLDALLLYPNVLRRMLETFIAFKKPASVRDFTGAMRSMTDSLAAEGYGGDPDALRLHLTRFTHANSHSESPESDVAIDPNEIDAAIAAVFTFMYVIDEKHFEGLCEVLGLEAGELLLTTPAATQEP
ncbi:ATP-binding protein [Jonesia denitrificans]|uniref:Protein CR006 P-loop domain-containing protein n=1 Tax=Jonesia denitrificans (strain ATCC 14870 / DSM 20603 / BCRC 15368 / CIP 55.134 / JCM 11481 / NBRC 15587 / NCTC 10816 / Prevot 55134) TaxID=471856 RepID=C7R4Y2_JONDD|nr:AAA family ATPase [Jonesia denitrificans]ACV09152.1 conserved hypothetical protein [Jonesia denitrificans DSM 20603]ASE09568.1 hypothetical protein CEP80_10825 [Jonesia denitrificans]QXB44111.1 AAA family ATPase [Jonesia denitrificans]SQH21377.1 Uncharacterized protein conserved in bacteria [Jonesia denitrificans]